VTPDRDRDAAGLEPAPLEPAPGEYLKRASMRAGSGCRHTVACCLLRRHG
jgi:hypothetical protein